MMLTGRSLALAGILLLPLPACAASPPSMGTPSGAAGIDLGPSTRVATSRLAVAGVGHDMYRYAPGKDGSGPVRQAHDGTDDAHATGTVNSVDQAQRKVNVSHDPIPSIGWPAMTMDFAVVAGVDLARVKPGSRINFTLQKGKGGMYEVQSVQPAGTGR